MSIGTKRRSARRERMLKNVNWHSVRTDLVGVSALRATKYGLGPIVVLTFMNFCQTFDSAIFALLQPEIREELDISLATLGTISAITGLIGLAAAPLVGHLADRRNRVHLLGLSAVLSGVFSLFTARANGVGQVYTARAIDNVSEQLGDIPAQTLTYDYYPIEARGKMVAFRSTVGRLLGFTVGPIVGGFAVLGGWRLPFLISGPLLIVSGVLGIKLLREPVRGYWERLHLGAGEDVASDPEPPLRTGEAARTIMAIRTLRRSLIGICFQSFFVGGFGFLYSFFLFDKFQLNPLQRSLVEVPAGIAALVGVVIGGAMTDLLIRYRPSRIMVLQGLVGFLFAASLLVQILTPSVWVLAGAGVLAAFLQAVISPASAVVFAHVLPPRLRGLGVGMVASVIGAIGLFGQRVGAQFGDAYGVEGGMLALLPLALISPVVVMSAAKFFEFDMRAALASAMAKEEYRLRKELGQTRLLMCKDVDVSYGSVQVLFNVDLTVDEGEIVALLGTNGAGKSTLLRAVSGIQEASNGAILFDGRDITHLPPNEISRLGITSMPGGKGTFPGLTVRENLELALWNCPESEHQERLESVYRYFPVLRERVDQAAGLLSGGEQQMVALGQAFLTRPRLLMIDELSLGLSPAVVGQLLDIVRAIHALGTTIILVEQSVNVALAVAERAVFMEKGQVRFEGKTSDLLARPDLMRAVYTRGAGALTDSGTGGARRTTSGAGITRPLLEVRGLDKRYGGKVAVHDVGFTLHEGEAIGFIGPNGAGKTTLFDLLSGYQLPDAGTIELDGAVITRQRPDERARAKLIRRFQDARLFPSLTVFETLCLALEPRAEVRNMFVIASQLPAARRSERRVRAAADRLVELLELGTYRDKFIADLSTGLRRVVDLACVLATEPRVLLLDEPSSGIAQAEAESLGPLLQRVRFETGCSLLLIEHDMTLVRAATDRLIAMVEGAIVADGEAAEVLSHPTVVAAYLGDKLETINRQGGIA